MVGARPAAQGCLRVRLSVCLSVRLSGAERLHKRGPQGGSRQDLGETWGEAAVSQACGMPGPWRARAHWAVRFGVTQGGSTAVQDAAPRARPRSALCVGTPHGPVPRSPEATSRAQRQQSPRSRSSDSTRMAHGAGSARLLRGVGRALNPPRDGGWSP